MRKKIVFYLNGARKEVGGEDAAFMLGEYLRYHQSLTGTKIVCAEGDCGACSVLRYSPCQKGVDTKNYLPINSCITPLVLLDGSSLVTVDALKNNHELSPAQKAMVSCHGSQCGFCTPGFVMALTGLVEEKLEKKEYSLSEQEAKNSLTGNLCRCTGYKPIIESAITMDLSRAESLKKRYFSSEQAKDLSQVSKIPVLIEEENFSYFAPTTIKEATNYLTKFPETKILGAATDLGVIHNKRKIKLNQLLSLHLIDELYEIKESHKEIQFGARVTHSEFRHFMKGRIPEFSNYLDLFASPQIKNSATVIGNIANASPIGDTPPALLALDATVILQGPGGKRKVPLKDFFKAYRKTTLEAGEIITHVTFRLPEKNSSLRFYKCSNRKDLDISAMNFAIHAKWRDEKKTELEDIMISAGGVAATPIRFHKTEEFLKKSFDIEKAIGHLHSEFTPLSDLRASAAYRHVLVENYFRKFFQEVLV